MTLFRLVKLLDLGGIEDLLKDIKEFILCFLMYFELYVWFGVDLLCGVLFYGLSGCGKTTLAYVIA